MQSPGRQSTGNTQVSPTPAVQEAWIVQKLPPTEQVPVEQFAEVVQKDPLLAQRAVQSVSRKHVEVEPMHWPGAHVPEAHPADDVHVEPPGSFAAHTPVGGVATSQKSSCWHCEVDRHGAPAASFGLQTPVGAQ